MKQHGIHAGACSYRLDRGSDSIEYRMSIQTRRDESVKTFADTLGKLDAVKELHFEPTGD